MRFVFLLLFFGVVNSNAQKVVWDKTNAFGLIPSEGWQIDRVEEEEIALIQKKQNLLGEVEGGHFSVSTASTHNWTLDELWEEYIIKGLPLMSGYEKVNSGTATVAGVKAKWIVYYSEDRGVRFRNLSLMVVKQNVMYVIAGTSLPESNEKVEKDFWSMINSLRIKEKKGYFELMPPGR
ncbi:MAG TPA: hypothetical protein DCG19_04145 [Cryomorphaceae bacterium]|nr:hypothetical protein [Owenweeksia sp.]MBF99619.1 hypothetical protein [Owenweeksia sp.]HAD96572.1 hypothetical protein [Cryomorphaceae bacterium]HBF21402.1 hypothetical protein [Cryomorphaceae bacterium]HCQ14958.1 hypothetical protein [Cryomorphaceae bacterium]|tara:strand:- start:13 stop:549 length:537 start_codon:yes stop_codon:yes gene_type:complete